MANFPKEVEHEAFEEWIFGEKDAAMSNQQNMSSKKWRVCFIRWPIVVSQ